MSIKRKNMNETEISEREARALIKKGTKFIIEEVEEE